MNVTPNLARRWLEKATQPVDDEKVRRYAEAMRDGDWRADGDPVVFRKDGTIVQGHHRLHAVIVAGVAVRMPVKNPPDAREP